MIMILQQKNLHQKMIDACKKASEALDNLTNAFNKLKYNRKFTHKSKFHK